MNRISAKHSLAVAGLFATGLLAASCATSSPDTRSPLYGAASVPGQWQASADEKEGNVASDWVQTFQSSELERFVKRTLDGNFRLQASAFQADAAAAAARISNASRWPNLGVGLNSGKQQSRFSALDFREFTTESHSLSLNTQWEIDLWNRLGKTAQSSRAQAEAARYDYHAASLSLAGQSSKAYFNAIAAVQLEDLARRNRELLAGRLEAIERRLDSGVVNVAELRTAEASLAAAEASLESRSIQRDEAVRVLQTLMADYPDGRLAFDDSLPSKFAAVPAGLPSELLSRRPDLAAEERRLAATILSEEAAQRNWLPRLAITGSAGTTSNELADLLDADFSVWSLFGDLSATLFSAGRLSAERDRARAQAEAALVAYRDSVLQAFREVETALGAEAALGRLVEQQERSAEAFSQSERRIESLYERGSADFFTLLDARARTLEAQTRLIEARNRRLQNRVDLYLALGGGFNVEPSSDETPSES